MEIEFNIFLSIMVAYHLFQQINPETFNSFVDYKG